MRTTVSRTLGVALGVLTAGALMAAASGITTRQARTGAPSTQTLSSSGNTEGSSLAFARSDHQHGFAGTAPAAADLLCSGACVSDGELVSAYSGVGTCAANTWASTLARNAAPSCTQPSFSSLSGVAALSQITDDDGSGAGTTCLKNGGAAGDPQWSTCPAGGTGYTPSHYTKLAHAYNDGDPGEALRQMQLGGTTAPTPSNLTTSVARISFFRLPFNLTVNTIRFYGIGATTGLYQIALYSYNAGGTGTRLHNQLALTTAASTWGSATVSPAVNLTAGALYFIAVTASGTGVTAGIASIGTSTTATSGLINPQPQNLPGNLDMDLGYLSGYKAQFNVTGGLLPATTPTLTGNAAWTGGFPAFFLDESAL